MPKQYVPIELDKTRNLRYGYKAMQQVEDRLGIHLSQLNFDSVSLNELAIILLAGLQHEDNDLTVDKLVDILDEFDLTIIEELAEKLGKAIGEAMGKNRKAPEQTLKKKRK